MSILPKFQTLKTEWPNFGFSAKMLPEFREFRPKWAVVSETKDQTKSQIYDGNVPTFRSVRYAQQFASHHFNSGVQIRIYPKFISHKFILLTLLNCKIRFKHYVDGLLSLLLWNICHLSECEVYNPVLVGNNMGTAPTTVVTFDGWISEIAIVLAMPASSQTDSCLYRLHVIHSVLSICLHVVYWMLVLYTHSIVSSAKEVYEKLDLYFVYQLDVQLLALVVERMLIRWNSLRKYLVC